MFWNSVGEGIRGVLDWHILIGILGIALVTDSYSMIELLIWAGVNSKRGIINRVIVLQYGGLLLNAIAISGFILICFPSLTGRGGFTSVEEVNSLFQPMFKAGFFAVVAVMLIYSIPFIGKIIFAVPGAPLFLQGMFLLKLISGRFQKGAGLTSIKIFPAWWNCIGFILIGIVVTFTVYYCLYLLIITLTKLCKPKVYQHNIYILRYTDKPTPLGAILTKVLVPLYGVLPILMCIKYMVLTIQAT